MLRKTLLFLAWGIYTGAMFGQTPDATFVMNDTSTFTSNKIGGNIGGNNYYDNPTLGNWEAGVNPSFQPVRHGQTVTVDGSNSSTTTFADFNKFNGVTANQYAGGTFRVMANGETKVSGVQVPTGGAGPSVNSVVPGTSGSVGCSGPITSNTAPTTLESIYTIGVTCPLFGNHSQVTILDALTPSPLSDLTFNILGFNHTETNGGVTAFDTNPADFPAAPFNGIQVIKLDTTSASNSTGDLWTFSDSGKQSHYFAGSYTQTIYYKVISGTGLNMVFSGSRSNNDGASWSVTVPMTSTTWAPVTATFNVTNPESNANPPGSLTADPMNIHNKQTGQGVVLYYRPSLYDAASIASGTEFSAETIANIQAVHLGQCRYWGGQLSDNLDNLIAPQWTRFPYAIKAGGQVGIQMGLEDFLVGARASGCESVAIAVPIIANWDTEWPNWSDFLAGGSGTTYGAKRIALGQTAGWDTVFKAILLTPGNEPWNSAQGNGSMTQYSVGSIAYWNYFPIATQDCGSIRRMASWNTSVMFCVGAMWTGNSGGTNVVLPSQDPNGYFDLAEDNEYSSFTITDTTGVDQYISAFTEQWANVKDTASKTGFYQINTCSGCRKVNIYEYSNSTNAGSINQTQMNGYPNGQAYGVVNTFASALAQREFGTLNSDYFTLYQNNQGISTAGGATTAFYWGMYVGAGGQYGRMRPNAQNVAMHNSCIGAGNLGFNLSNPTNVTYNFSGYNNVNAQSNVPYAHAFGWKNGTTRCVELYNIDTANSHTYSISGTNSPTGTVTTVSVPGNLADNNETPNVPLVVFPVTSTLTNPTSFTVPAHTAMTVTWTAGSTASNPSVRGGNTTSGGNTISN